LPKFEECLQRLEKIVQELEKGDVPLENNGKLQPAAFEPANDKASSR
jgi:exonuclease VII small subunit